VKLISYRHENREAFGAIVNSPYNDRIVTFGAEITRCYTDLKSTLADPDSIEVLRRRVLAAGPGLSIDEVTLLPVIPNPGAILVHRPELP
jgi:hypothetical protein